MVFAIWWKLSKNQKIVARSGVIQDTRLYLLSNKLLRKAKRLQFWHSFFVDVNRRMIDCDFVQLWLRKGQGFNTCMQGAISTIGIATVADEEILNSNLVYFGVPILFIQMDVVHPASEWLQCIDWEQLLVVEALLHGLTILCRAQPGMTKDFRDWNTFLYIHQQTTPNQVL